MKEAIAAAKKEEATARSLEKLIYTKRALLPALQRTTTLPDIDSPRFLEKFLLRYIETVPELLDAVRTVSQEAGIYRITKTFIEIAQDFFKQAIEDSRKLKTGLHTVMGEAYLAHRLFEELNDYIYARAGVPLLPLDFTASNIIVHEILGEAFANQLDLSVHYSIEALLNAKVLSDGDNFDRLISLHQNGSLRHDFSQLPYLNDCRNEELALKLSQIRSEHNNTTGQTQLPIIH